MKILLSPKWRTGLIAGLILGSLLSLLLYHGWHAELGVEKPVRWLASCPPLSWRWVMDLSAEIQFAMLIAWWGMAGAALGWLVEGNRSDKATAALLAVTLLSAHNLSYNNLGLAVERNIRHFQQEMNRLF